MNLFKSLRPAKENVSKSEIVDIQRRIEFALNPLAEKKISAGDVLCDSNKTPVDIDLVYGQVNLVEHGLGRASIGYIVTWSNTPVMTWVPSATYDETKYIALGCSCSATVRLLVF